MRQMLWVAERELRERKIVFAGALLLGLLALGVPFLPTFGDQHRFPTMRLMGAIFSIGYSVSVAMLAGASVFGRDLAERRLGFYFSRPLTSRAIWGGKILGAFLLSILSGLLALVPVSIVAGGPDFGPLGRGFDARAWGTAAGALVFLLLFLIAASHALSVALRARTRWLVLDAIVLPLLLFSFWLALWPIVRVGAFDLAKACVVAIAFALPVALLVSGAVGIAHGRSDIHAVHRASAIALCVLVGVLAIGFSGYSAWVRSATLADIRTIVDAGPAGGPWVTVVGEARGRWDYHSTFLVHAETLRAIRTLGLKWGTDVAVSEDGSRAISIGLSSFNPVAGNLIVTDLSDPPRERITNLTLYPQSANGPVLSSDGARVAFVQDRTLSVYDLDSERSLGSVLVPGEAAAYAINLFFLTPDRLRLHVPTGTRIAPRTEIFEFDLSAGRLERTGSYEGYAGRSENPDHETMLGVRSNPRSYRLFNARTGEVLATFAPRPGQTLWSGWITSAGPAVASIEAGNVRLQLFDATAQLIRSADLGPGTRAVIGGEPAAGSIVVSVQSASGDDLKLVDLSTGGVRSLGRDLRPIVGWWRFPKPGAVATKVFYRPGRKQVVFFDPINGEERVIAGNPSH